MRTTNTRPTKYVQNKHEKSEILLHLPASHLLFVLFCSLHPQSLCLVPLQSDNLLSYLTVEETLTYTAQLALRKHSAEAIKKKVTLESLFFSVHLARS